MSQDFSQYKAYNTITLLITQEGKQWEGRSWKKKHGAIKLGSPRRLAEKS